MYKNLNHLSEEQIENLMDRYYAGESVSKLISKFQLDVSPNALYKIFPPEEHSNYICDYCGSTLFINMPSKNTRATNNKQDLYCPICDHKPFIASHCNCKNCKEFRINLIRNTYIEPQAQVDFNNTSFLSKVYLGALCRVLLKENLYEISPYSSIHMPLAPSDTLTKEIYDVLFDNNVIAVSPTSPVEAFNVENENFPNVFYTYEVTYNLNLYLPSNKQQLFEEILNPTYYCEEYQAEALLLWKKIAVAECVQYLNYQLKNVGFVFSPGEKTYKTFEIILNDFSVAQTYGIIWKAVADASKLYLEKNISKKHAANTTISACERYAERAKINGWDLKAYGRVKDLPQSALSSFYYNRVLGIGDMGFTVPPTIV